MSVTTTYPSLGDLLSLDNRDLAKVDPLVMNLAVAKGIPALADLEIGHYATIADDWAAGVAQMIDRYEPEFHKTPDDWQNDLRFFGLGVLCQYLDVNVGIAYNADQRENLPIPYVDPRDLFVNGLMDRLRGTCGTMAALHVALGWRLGWPVSIACIKSHNLCRFDDGEVTYNIEATVTGRGGFSSQSDDYYRTEYALSPRAIAVGCDLRALSPREMLGVFVQARARHFRDLGNTIAERGDAAEADELLVLAERDYLLARYLFPTSRNLYAHAMGVTVRRGTKLFSPDEEAHPLGLSAWLIRCLGVVSGTSRPARPSGSRRVESTDACFSEIDTFFRRGP